MMSMWEEPTRDERMQRHIRDSAVAGAVATHADRITMDVDQRLIHEIAQLAVHNALTQYAANLKTDIARVESFERMQMDKAMLRTARMGFISAAPDR